MSFDTLLTLEEQLWFSKTYKTQELVCSSCGPIAEFYQTDNLNHLLKLNHEERTTERVYLNLHVAIGDAVRHEEQHLLKHRLRKDADVKITRDFFQMRTGYSDFNGRRNSDYCSNFTKQ